MLVPAAAAAVLHANPLQGAGVAPVPPVSGARCLYQACMQLMTPEPWRLACRKRIKGACASQLAVGKAAKADVCILHQEHLCTTMDAESGGVDSHLSI